MFNAASSFLAWIIDNALTMMFISITSAVVLELIVRRLSRRSIDVSGSVTSISAALAYISTKGIVSKLAMLAVSLWVHDRFAIFDLDATNPVVWLTMFVCRDFVYYWIHRAEHSVRVLWASHLVHHSSEQFTFTTAVRMPWMEAVYKPFLGLWAPLLGFHPIAFGALGALLLLVGQFQHTELLKRRTVLDRVFVTPGAHRVHHGSNPQYIDKNFGSMLIVWDRIFGTYEPESEAVRYGLVGDKPVRNPRQALTGGYPRLRREVKGRTLRASVRHLLSAPS